MPDVLSREILKSENRLKIIRCISFWEPGHMVRLTSNCVVEMVKNKRKFFFIIFCISYNSNSYHLSFDS